MKALEIKNLNYFHKSNWMLGKKQSLFDISLSVEEGDAYALLGPNGAGKTTTIKCILGLLRAPSESTINIFNTSHRSNLARKEVGFLPEQTYFYDNIKARESVILAARLAGVERVEEASQAALEKLSIVDIQHKKLRNMSKGQKQRVSLAQALVSHPRLLILDEPFSGLDPIGRKHFSDIFFELKKKGVTLLMSSHILSDVEAICDKAAILKKGVLLGTYDISHLENYIDRSFDLVLAADAPALSVPNARITEHASQKVYRFSSRADAEKALEIAVRSDSVILSFGSSHGGLEELFINLVEGGSK